MYDVLYPEEFYQGYVIISSPMGTIMAKPFTSSEEDKFLETIVQGEHHVKLGIAFQLLYNEWLERRNSKR